VSLCTNSIDVDVVRCGLSLSSYRSHVMDGAGNKFNSFLRNGAHFFIVSKKVELHRNTRAAGSRKQALTFFVLSKVQHVV